MTNIPDQSIFDTLESGDSGIQNLYVYGKLNYNFENDDISLKSINASSKQTIDQSINKPYDLSLIHI